MNRTLSLLLPLVLFSSCQREPDAPTAAENRQLDEAANLLNEAPTNLEAIDDGGLGATNAQDETPPDAPVTDAGSY